MKQKQIRIILTYGIFKNSLFIIIFFYFFFIFQAVNVNNAGNYDTQNYTIGIDNYNFYSPEFQYPKPGNGEKVYIYDVSTSVWSIRNPITSVMNGNK